VFLLHFLLQKFGSVSVSNYYAEGLSPSTQREAQGSQGISLFCGLCVSIAAFALQKYKSLVQIISN
jgi:hypothetical protein